MGDGNYGSGALTSVTVYAPQGMNVSAQDQSDTDLNLLAAVKEDAALISGKDIKVKLAPSSADKMAGDYAPFHNERQECRQMKLSILVLERLIQSQPIMYIRYPFSQS